MYRIHQITSQTKSRYLQRQWDLRQYEEHRHRIRTMKPLLEQNEPRIYPHLYNNSSKTQSTQDRMIQIDKENRNLMKRLCAIMRAGGHYGEKNKRKLPPFKSNNLEGRRRDMINIAYNNLMFYQRVLGTQTHYSRSKYENEYLIQQKYKAFMTKYPPNWRELLEKEKKLKKKIRQELINKEKRMKKKAASFSIKRRETIARSLRKPKVIDFEEEKENISYSDPEEFVSTIKLNKSKKEMFSELELDNM